MHGTNVFDRDIKVGPKRQEYTRVVAYPNEITSSYLGWLNMYQFRSRGWRCDLIFAVVYLGIGKGQWRFVTLDLYLFTTLTTGVNIIVSSFFPLCGVYGK